MEVVEANGMRAPDIVTGDTLAVSILMKYNTNINQTA